MSAVTELGYVGLAVSDLQAWRRFATEIVGMEWADGPDDRVAYLRMDGWHRRIALHAGENDDLAYLGWRVSDEAALGEIAARLQAQQIDFRWASDHEADERHVMGMVKTRSPGGIETDIFWGPQVDAHQPFHPGRRMYGRFRTGEAGLGHIAVNEPDAEAALLFYRQLGFKGNRQYKLRLPNGIVVKPVFLYCNTRQHSLQFDLGPMPRAVNHLAIEYSDLNDVGYANDLIRKRGIDVALDIGKHANDQAVSFYAANPSKWLWELSWGCRAPPAQDEYYTWDLYGHKPEAGGYGLDMETTL